jgi:hypothetical protein
MLLFFKGIHEPPFVGFASGIRRPARQLAPEPVLSVDEGLKRSSRPFLNAWPSPAPFQKPPTGGFLLLAHCMLLFFKGIHEPPFVGFAFGIRRPTRQLAPSLKFTLCIFPWAAPILFNNRKTRNNGIFGTTII